MSIESIYDLTRIDPWFLYQLDQILAMEKEISSCKQDDQNSIALPDILKKAKSFGFSDMQIAYLSLGERIVLIPD